MRSKLILAAVGLAAALSACKGDTGPKGPNGTDGMDGNAGPKGDPGATGKNGADGKTGATGSNGADGKNGKDGSNGGNGTNGTNGSNGTNGTNGTNGANGNDIILSETARLGLKLSQVPVDVTGLAGDDVESVGRGAYLVNAVADCTGCHNGTDNQGNTLFLAGNVAFPIGSYDPNNPGIDCNVASPPAGCVAGTVFTRNLTPHADTGLKLSEDQFVEALRTGRDFKDATGQTSLIVMPWAQLRWLSDQDLHDIYHYLRQIPAINNPVNVDAKPTFAPAPAPSATFGDGAVTRSLPAAFDPAVMHPTQAFAQMFDSNNVLRGLAISPLNDDAVVATLSAADQALYGRGSYIVNGPGLCNECHTVRGRKQDGTVKTAIFLAGGQAFAVPPPLQPILKQVRTMSANLTGKDHGFKQTFQILLDTWLEGTSFTKATPHALGFPMPFDTFRNMTLADKEAVYTYITTIQQHNLITGDQAHQAPARFCTPATAGTDCPGTGETCAAITINGMATHECVGAACTTAADCGACQTCVGTSTKTCAAEDPTSTCVTSSF